MLMTDTMSRSPPTYTFGDETSSSPGRSGGRKHRRGRGYTPPGAAKSNSYRQGGQNHSPVAAWASHSRSSSPGNQRQHHQPQPQANYSFSAGDAWNTPSAKSNNGNDDNSLTYSASSSVQSAESSNSSSFAEIFKVMGSEEEGQMKEFMAKQTKAACASEGGAVLGAVNGDSDKTTVRDSGIASNNAAAVAGWMQRNQPHQPQQKKHQLKNMARTRQQHSSPVDWNYSKDSSEDDVFDVNFTEYEENVLETIAGKCDEDNVVAHRITVTSQSPADDDLLFADDPFASNNYSRDVTPPPNARHRRTLTPPGSLSRTNSRHSKSSSDGSWDTPTASSPPHGGTPGASKPPTRGAKAGRAGRRRSEEKGGDMMEESLKEAFYTKSWMCGFTDAFNFDGLDTFQK